MTESITTNHLNLDEICSLSQLALDYNKYPSLVLPLHAILKDIKGKRELTGLVVVDGNQCGRPMYFVEGINKLGGKRIFVPLAYDADIDLEW